MTREEAFIALEQGHKIRHRHFTYDEFIYIGEDGYLLDEQGLVMGAEFWHIRRGQAFDEGWSILPNSDTNVKVSDTIVGDSSNAVG